MSCIHCTRSLAIMTRNHRLTPEMRSAGLRAGRSRRGTSAQRGGTTTRGRGWGRGGRCGCLCWKIKLRHGVERAPPVPVWERGGPLDPREALRILNIWDPQNKVMGSRGGFWKEESHLRARGRNVRLWRDLARDGHLGLGKSNGNVGAQDIQVPRSEQGKGSGKTGLGSKGQEGLKVLPSRWDGDLH